MPGNRKKEIAQLPVLVYEWLKTLFRLLTPGDVFRQQNYTRSSNVDFQNKDNCRFVFSFFFCEPFSGNTSNTGDAS